MEIVRIADIPAKGTPRGVQGRSLVDLPDVSVMNLILSAGDKVPEHVTPVDVLFHVLEGEGTVIIGEEKAKVKAGEIIISPANIPHALEADCGSNFSFLVIKTPNPKKKL
ncbi:MAG: cupin domain-containing protein [Firmicutes bacterium]|nr:cupin domain-containing protein [Bacillota bacterium]